MHASAVRRQDVSCAGSQSRQLQVVCAHVLALTIVQCSGQRISAAVPSKAACLHHLWQLLCFYMVLDCIAEACSSVAVFSYAILTSTGSSTLLGTMLVYLTCVPRADRKRALTLRNTQLSLVRALCREPGLLQRAAAGGAGHLPLLPAVAHLPGGPHSAV